MSENELHLATGQEVADILHKYKNIAVVGLSDNPARPSYGVSAYMQAAGYNIIPVNPIIQEVLGQPSHASLQDISESVEIVDVFRRSEDVLPIVDEAIAIGAKVLWLQLGVINVEAAKKAQAAGLQVVMDKCIKVEHARYLGR